MTRFPPGFTLETAQHLRYLDPPIDERTGVPVVDLENYCCGSYLSKHLLSAIDNLILGAHGFSALIVG